MSMKGSPAKSTSGSGQQWAQPFATQGAQDIMSTFNAAQPGLQATQANVNSQLANLGATGQGMAAQTGAFGQTAGKANSYYGDVIGGKYMSGNPYIKNILGQLDESIMNGVNSNFESAGRYGSGAYVGEMGKQLGNANMQLLYGNYADEMNRRMQASGQADSAFAQQQQAQTANAQQQLSAAQLASQVPYTGINAMGNSLGALFNGGTEKGATQGWGSTVGAIGAGLASNTALFSDPRMKTKIELLRRDPDGLGWYRFAYKRAPDAMLEGVMADEVKELRPQAYVPNYQGSSYDAVNYAAL